MSLWSRFTSFLAKALGADVEPPPVQPAKSVKPAGKRVGPSTPKPFKGVDRPDIKRGKLRHRRYDEVWAKVYDDLETSLPATAIEEFNERESRFRALYNVWSDPGESDDMQLAAYENFWDDMADFGYSVADFDWADFKQKYESLGG